MNGGEGQREREGGREGGRERENFRETPCSAWSLIVGLNPMTLGS